ncbi:hypothetical protein SCHPADRAFT_903950 [Schizopora paradoxa]|uniref:MYND-type domain-containing protein n=1 Tax=Schizopora paradoxa TaxID=27342 RepID=A0A0H2RP42_9AGAM|nr:hypothetical protein SCHPADRAFT_903950 [Schizopora paradoxa]
MQALDSTPMACDNCFRFDERANFKKCAGCGMAHYCSKDCQSRAWKENGHRIECSSLKVKQAKSSRRKRNDEKYFLARVAVNDAQQKKERLKQMTSIGLEYVSVTVDYTEFPPRCTVDCDMDDLRSFIDGSCRMMDATKKFLRRREEVRREQSELPLEGASDSLAKTHLPTLNLIHEGGNFDYVDPDGARILRIRLVDYKVEEDARSTYGAPPVDLIIRLPSEDGTLVQTEHFLIEDFWELVHIKFDDSDADSEFVQEEPEGGRGVVSVRGGTSSPQAVESPQGSSLKVSRRELAAKKGADVVGLMEDELLDIIKELQSTRNSAIKAVLGAAMLSS